MASLVCGMVFLGCPVQQANPTSLPAGDIEVYFSPRAAARTPL
jgi:hypothetical protein